MIYRHTSPRLYYLHDIFFFKLQQGHTPAYYRDHPQDIRHRTVQSRKPPPLPSKLIKSDPDSATSPSKYSPGSKDSATLSANQKNALPDSSDNGSEAGTGSKRKVLRKKKKKKHSNAPDSASSQQGPPTPNQRTKSVSGGAGAAGGGGPPPPPTHGVLIAKAKQQEAEILFKSDRKEWETEKRDHLNLSINKLVHKSKSNFLLQDIKHAMDTAKILERSESMSHDPDNPDDER